MAARTATRVRRPTRPRWVRRTKQGLAWLLMLMLIGITAFGVYFMMLFRQAQDQMGTLEDHIRQTMMPASEVVSADGQVLFRIAQENRIPVKFSEVPKNMRYAMLAAEDKRFYNHAGFDLVGLGRAVASAVKDKRVSQGGSTLEMQLSKLMYSGTERTIKRKLSDIAIASAMEKELSKDQILLLYLNYVYFGESAHGIGAAARIYFNKNVSNLNLAEAAMLARCVRRPSVDNPFSGRTKQQIALNLPSDRSMENKATVLNVMRQEGWVTEDQYQKALKIRPRLNPDPPRTTASFLRAPYFVNHVLSILNHDMPDLDLKSGGYRIETTLDTRLQAVTEGEVRKVVRESRNIGATTGAFVVMDSEGRILSEVGGVDYHRNQLNAVFQGDGRQPGSSFKPIVYAAALASGSLGFGELISNQRKSYWDKGSRKWYQPRNDSEHFGSYVPLNVAIQWSINRCAVNTLANMGVGTLVGYARDTFGFPAKRFAGAGETSYSIALGSREVLPIEMAEAYSVFMTGGDRVEPRPILRVIGPDGDVIRRYDTVRFTRVLDPSVVSQIDDALRDVVEGGTGTLANVVPDARGKTGTTTDGKDLWFCGYSDGLVGIGWVASEHPKRGGKGWEYRPMNRGWGGTVTVKIWAGVMKEAHKRFAHKIAVPSDEAPVPPIEDVKPIVHRQEKVDTPQVDEPKPIPDEPTARVEPPQREVPPVIPDTKPENDTPIDVPAVTNDTPDRPRRRRRDNPPPEQEMVEVEVCADTGMRASMYCPETVPKLFPKGREPKKICTLHRGGGF